MIRLCLCLAFGLGSFWLTASGNEAAAQNPPDVRAELIKLEREWTEIPDGPTVGLCGKHLRKMADAARQLIVLTVDGVDYPAESVYFTDRPEGYVCRLLFADDTPHTTEFPLSQTVVPWQASGVFQLRRPVPASSGGKADDTGSEVTASTTAPEPAGGGHPKHASAATLKADDQAWPEVFAADPGEMHNASFTVTINHPDSEGRFQPTLRRTNRQQLLFMIIKEPDTRFYRKYVWVIAPANMLRPE